MNDNDKKIFDLKEKLQAKKKNLGKKPDIKFKTNCIFTLFGNTYNLHILNEFELNMLVSWFKGIGHKIQINGYTVEDYLMDIKNKLIMMDYNKSLNNIKEMESKLDALISSETKTSIEIDKLAEQIG